MNAASNPELYRQSMKKLSDVIVYDIFSPPVAARIYAYPNIAAYETIIHDFPAYKSLSNQLHELAPVPDPDPALTYNFPLASIQAFLKVGKTLIFSEEKIEEHTDYIYDCYKDTGMPDEIFKNSIAYGNQVAEHILAWSKKDNYHETRTFPKFTINSDDSARWQPTPPAYIDAIEPHWSKIRPFVIDSATQFVPIPPTPFNIDKTSKFYEEMIVVYETGLNLTPEQTEIAKFWDCNPYVSHSQGHLMFATKKITPGGHWMGIASIASRVGNSDIAETIQAYTYVSIALMDAFISCWDEKYRSELIRPETVINQYVDENWVPLLQTPPFPEYTSGHSVISASAATVLTEMYGEPFHFVDSTEWEFGLPPRTFDSFFQASNEAAISRLYGGIHYLPACSVGVVQGKKVGKFIKENIQFKNNSAVKTSPGETEKES